MTNVLIGAPIYSDAFDGNLYTPALSGGLWEAANPLANLQDRALWKIARSQNDARASTQFTADLGANRPIRCVALVGHSISDTAPSDTFFGAPEVRVRGFTAPPLVDAGGDGYRPFTFGWTEVGTPTRTPNAFACSDGVYLDLIGDDSGASAEYYSRAATFTGNGVKTVRFRMARSSAYNGHFVGIYDATAAAYVALVNIDYTTTTPIVGATAGTLLSSTARGDGSYTVVLATTSVTASNTFELRVFPAGAASADTAAFHCGDIQVFNSATDPLVHDTGMTRAHPTGTTREDRIGLTPTWARWFATATARYWVVNINDDNNPDGYVDVGRLVIAAAYEPSVNFTTGADLTHESETTTQYTRGGAAVHDERPLRRVARFVIPNIADAEAVGQALKLSRQMGARGQCLLVLRPDADASIRDDTTFLAVPREQTRLEYPYAMYRNAAYAFTEEL